ncbi:MAG: hypothetical protein HQ478_16575 [Chloroflexi bacterium]|nr:hypothetical protein [Chloroflexota bacterium]
MQDRTEHPRDEMWGVITLSLLQSEIDRWKTPHLSEGQTLLEYEMHQEEVELSETARLFTFDPANAVAEKPKDRLATKGSVRTQVSYQS